MTDTSSVLAWILFFYVYCFLGWCVESLYVSFFQRKWINRGFMHGPYIPLYGTGALLVTYVTLPVEHSVLWTFIIGALAASVLEYITGVLMESIFKVRYWDYSEMKFNINGHVCLLNTLEWGFLSVFLVFFLDKPIAAFVNSITEPVQTVLALVISVIFFSDFVVSVKAALDVRDMIIKMTEAKEELYRLQRRLDVLIAVADDSFENWKEEKRDLMEDKLEKLEADLGVVRTAREERRAEQREALKRLEDKLAILHEKESSAKFAETFREELESLREKSKAAHKRINGTEKKLGIHGNLLLNSPTATSKKFKEAFEELVEQARLKKDEKKNGGAE